MTEDNVRQKTKTICDAYTELTGRPAAGLSVSEFLLMRTAAISEIKEGAHDCGTILPATDSAVVHDTKNVAAGRAGTRSQTPAQRASGDKPAPATKKKTQTLPAETDHKADGAPPKEPPTEKDSDTSFYDALASFPTPWDD